MLLKNHESNLQLSSFHISRLLPTTGLLCLQGNNTIVQYTIVQCSTIYFSASNSINTPSPGDVFISLVQGTNNTIVQINYHGVCPFDEIHFKPVYKFEK